MFADDQESTHLAVLAARFLSLGSSRCSRRAASHERAGHVASLRTTTLRPSFRPTGSRRSSSTVCPGKESPHASSPGSACPSWNRERRRPGSCWSTAAAARPSTTGSGSGSSRGYAAIAMDTCGCVPKGSYGKWQRHDAGGPPGWGDFEHADEPIEDQWPYHAVADVILAHSLLRAMPERRPRAHRHHRNLVGWIPHLHRFGPRRPLSVRRARLRLRVSRGRLGVGARVQEAGPNGRSLARDVGPVPLSQERQDAQALGDRHQ